MTLIASRATQVSRTRVFLTTGLVLVAAYVAVQAHIAFAPAVFLAMAMGGAHCVFERDNSDLQEAMSPSAQIARFCESLAGGRSGANHRQIGLHAFFWLAFLFCGLLGAGAWIAFFARSFAMAPGGDGVLTRPRWLIARDRFPA